ncbi:FecR family protein [Solitalea lacus]|uniref:FecR family protein n=1 Tax=Solitalea lacus TaxID=2911172 RepID=UPI001EDBAF8A|nr:FecR domain-containing protein [Solitalea lacus]UKJ08552.1 FecR domain-containing protein [Solitalea lacus]
MMNKPNNTGNPEWEQVLCALAQGDEINPDRLNQLSDEERGFIAELVDKRQLTKAVSQLHEIDLQKDWLAVKTQVDRLNASGRVFQLKNWLLHYAAVLILPLTILGALYFGLKNNDKIAQSSTVAQKEAGDRGKATLILGDGKKVELTANQVITNSDGARIRSDSSNALVYESEQNVGDKASYNTLIIPKGGSYKLMLEDGTEIWVNADSRLKYQVNFDVTKTREVFLESGEAYFKVAKNPDKPFIVHNRNMDIRVLGTSFNVNAYSKSIQTTLVEGKVKISVNNSQNLDLTPGQQASFDELTGSLEKQDVDVYSFVAWKDDIIAFDNVTMEGLMEQIGRLYDYDIQFKDESLKKLHYSGSADKSESVRDVLNIIQRTSNLQFTIKERSIIIEKMKRK